MADLHGLLSTSVAAGEVPGAAALVARRGDAEVVAVGAVDVAGTGPMTRESIVRIASLTRPVVAAAAMVLVEEGVIALDDPIGTWLPAPGRRVTSARGAG
ncbi:MAG TPA: serine hydrolase [Kineosporiaceae bacterium]